MAVGDRAPVLEAGEEALDPVALLVEFSVVAGGVLAPVAGRDAGGNPFVLKGLAEPVGIVSGPLPVQSIAGRVKRREGLVLG